MKPVFHTFHDSPLGTLLLIGNSAGLTNLHIKDGKHVPAIPPDASVDATPFREILRQLDEYFTGNRRTFDVALALAGTPFQQRVWQALREIPYGQTLSYAALAARLGQPTAVRAVANANARNRIAIIIPCHRVIGANGSLTGYAGGLAAKEALLKLEVPL
ncbi:MAG: methylated-DNA--[protein]-cysteine S-methyltransferase [Verrucomicrobiota bacterium]